MKEFGFIRHGSKLDSSETRKPLEESGLTPEQQEKWSEAVTRLGIEGDPQIGYENLPLIEAKAREMYEHLPERATVIFTSTDYPRTRLTADLLSTELIRQTQQDNTKDIRVAFLWEHPEAAGQDDSMSNILNMKKESAANQRLLRDVQKRDYPDDADLEEYLKHSGSKTYANEDEALRRAVNLDLESEGSQYRQRTESFRSQLRNIETTFGQNDDPVFFYAVGHHPNLITLDVAINGRSRYEDSNEIPKPLTLWKVDQEKMQAFLEGN